MRKVIFSPEALQERLQERFPDWCPVEQLAQIAKEDPDVEVQIKAATTVAKYLYPAQTLNQHNVKGDFTLNLVDYFQEARQRLQNEALVAPNNMIDVTPTSVTTTTNATTGVSALYDDDI